MMTGHCAWKLWWFGIHVSHEIEWLTTTQAARNKGIILEVKWVSSMLYPGLSLKFLVAGYMVQVGGESKS